MMTSGKGPKLSRNSSPVKLTRVTVTLRYIQQQQEAGLSSGGTLLIFFLKFVEESQGQRQEELDPLQTYRQIHPWLYRWLTADLSTFFSLSCTVHLPTHGSFLVLQDKSVVCTVHPVPCVPTQLVSSPASLHELRKVMQLSAFSVHFQTENKASFVRIEYLDVVSNVQMTI